MCNINVPVPETGVLVIQLQYEISALEQRLSVVEMQRDQAREDVKTLKRLLDNIVDACQQERKRAREKAQEYALEAEVTSMKEKRKYSRESERAWICQGFGIDACERAIYYVMKEVVPDVWNRWHSDE